MQENEILLKQLSRIRSLNNFYHRQFINDVRYGIFIVLSVYIFAYTYSLHIFLLLPYIILLFSVLLAHHAHYLIFSRLFSEDIEKRINLNSSKDILIAHKIENTYFFPTSKKKIVVAGLGKDFTWFSFVTIFITTLGLLSYTHSAFIIYQEHLVDTVYFTLLAFITVSTLVVGIWWFPNGVGEARIIKVLRATYEL